MSFRKVEDTASTISEARALSVGGKGGVGDSPIGAVITSLLGRLGHGGWWEVRARLSTKELPPQIVGAGICQSLYSRFHGYTVVISKNVGMSQLWSQGIVLRIFAGPLPKSFLIVKSDQSSPSSVGWAIGNLFQRKIHLQ
jgi:hypothetical protein